MAQSAVFMSPNSSGVGDNKIVTGLSWSERMDLEDESAEGPADNSTGDRSGSDKVHLTQIQDSTKEGLRKASNPMNNAERRQLRQQFIVPDAAFIMSPRLDKIMAAECSKSTKSADHQLSRIQALFLDAAGPLSGLLDSINQGTEVTLDDVESAVKAALNFLENASCHCTTLRHTGGVQQRF